MVVGTRGAGVGGNTPAQYVAAYRHVFDPMAQADSTNGAVMWSPNGVSKLRNNVRDFFQGRRYLALAGPDIYNNSENHATATALYDQTVNEIRALTPEPILFAETGAHTGSNRAVFIASLFDYMNSGTVDGFVQMQITREKDGATGDYQIDPGLAADTFKAGMAGTSLKAFPVIPLP